jgi:tetratricopeptide (TPR) repeat protein
MRFALGLAYYGGSNYEGAIPVFADLLHTDPNSTVYAEMFGQMCAFLTEGSDSHCSTIAKIAEQHPEDAALATYAATVILHEQYDPQRFETAHRLLDTAIRLHPAFPEARYGMGLLLQREGHWEESIPELQAAIRHKADYAQAHYHLGLAYSRTGRKEQAKSEMELEQKYKQQTAKDLDMRLNQITTILVSMK